MRFSEWIILRTCGQTWYYYCIPPTSDLAHHEILCPEVGKGGIKSVHGSFGKIHQQSTDTNGLFVDTYKRKLIDKRYLNDRIISR